MRLVLLLSCLLLLFSSCKDSYTYPYALADFRSEIQPVLRSLVDGGIVGGPSKGLDKKATTNELRQLLRSEHPVLRGFALRLLFFRSNTADKYQLLLQCLADTAMVRKDNGEFGIIPMRLADHALSYSTFLEDAQEDSIKVVVLRNFNHLSYAYHALLEMPMEGKANRLTGLLPKPELYSIVQAMARRPIPLRDREQALYALASYRVPADIPLVRSALLEGNWQMGGTSFRLMLEFPDTSYHEAMERFADFGIGFKEQYSEFDPGDEELFFEAVASYQDSVSLRILQKFIGKLEAVGDRRDNYQVPIAAAVRKYPCALYKPLMPVVDRFEQQQHARARQEQAAYEAYQKKRIAEWGAREAAEAEAKREKRSRAF